MIKEIKICFEKTFKRIAAPSTYKNLCNYLTETLFNDHKQIFSVIYYDKEGDCIQVSNDKDYQGAVNYMTKNKIDLLRMFINVHKEKNQGNNDKIDLYESNSISKSNCHFISFLNHFLKFAYENYTRVDKTNRIIHFNQHNSLTTFREKHLISILSPSRIEKAKLIYDWLKVARAKLKHKKFNKRPGHFICSIEGFNRIRIRYIFKNEAKIRDSKSKTVKIIDGSYERDWLFEYGVDKMFNLLCFICENFFNLSLHRKYSLSDF